MTSSSRAARAEQTRRLMIDTARRLFTELGYDATSLQMIADEIGLTKAAVYYHFPTKAEILHAIVVETLRSYDDLLDIAAAQPTKPGRIQSLVELYVELMISSRAGATMKNSDPGIQRELQGNKEIWATQQRGLTIAFGDWPSPDERAAYQLLLRVPVIVAELSEVSDDDLRATLTRTCLRLLRVRS